METKDHNAFNEERRSPAPETIDQQKEGERLIKEDRERFDNQGSKEEPKEEKAAHKNAKK